MLGDILTWVGAMLGITVLVAMAFGAVAVDLDARFQRRPVRPASPPTAAGDGVSQPAP